jgi:hypothetical protein
MDDPVNNSINVVSTGLGTVANSTYNYVNTLLINPSVIIMLVVVLILYLVLFMSLGNNNTAITNSGTSSITTIVIVLFMMLVIINGLQYFYGLDIIMCFLLFHFDLIIYLLILCVFT